MPKSFGAYCVELEVEAVWSAGVVSASDTAVLGSVSHGDVSILTVHLLMD